MEPITIGLIIAISTGLVVWMSKLIYSSKCTRIKCCWNCCEIIRDTDREVSLRNIGDPNFMNNENKRSETNINITYPKSNSVELVKSNTI